MPVLVRTAAFPALALAGLLAASFLRYGAATPPTPQALADAAYRALLTGNPDDAVNQFRRALRDDPAFAYRWSDLGEALAARADVPQAAYCFRRAVELAPGSPQIAMRAANFAFRTGDTASGIRLSSAVLRLTPDFDAMVFSSWMRLGGDLKLVLDGGVGTNPRAAEALFRFLLSDRQSPESAEKARAETWAWLEAHSKVNEALARTWVDWLIAHHREADAVPVWKRYAASDPQWAVRDWIDNGGFEKTPSGDGFDWRITDPAGVKTAVDPSVAHSGRSSLRLDFDGTVNVEFQHVAQRVAPPPGRYRLSAWVKTADLSTDQGVALFFNGASTPALNGTHDWTELSTEVTVPSGASPGEVQLVRRRSLRFDSKPRGKVWVDDVTLRKVE